MFILCGECWVEDECFVEVSWATMFKQIVDGVWEDNYVSQHSLSLLLELRGCHLRLVGRIIWEVECALLVHQIPECFNFEILKRLADCHLLVLFEEMSYYSTSEKDLIEFVDALNIWTNIQDFQKTEWVTTVVWIAKLLNLILFRLAPSKRLKL